MQGWSSLVSSNLTTVLINNLQPDTKYFVYCYTEDYGGNGMPLEKVKSTEVSARTGCCRSITTIAVFYNLYQYFSGNGRSESQFQIALDSAPSLLTSIVLNATKADCTTGLSSGEYVNIVYPSSFTFLPNSSLLTMTFVVRTQNTGCYQIKASSTTGNYYRPWNTTVSVRRASAAPSQAPQVLSASFSTNGLQMLVQFDSMTDRGFSKISTYDSIFSCAKLLIFTGYSTSRCKWSTNSSLLVDLHGAVLPTVGENVTILGSIVRPQYITGTDQSSYPYTSQASTILLGPQTPFRPVVLLAASSFVSYCDNITVDPTATYGAEGRAWSLIHWIVTDLTTFATYQEITDYLNENYNTTNLVAVIPNSMIKTGVQYVFTLQVTNFLAQSSAGMVVSEMQSKPSPQVSIYGTDRLYYTWRTISLYAFASIPSCAASSSNDVVQYSWVLYKDLKAVLGVRSTSLDPRYFTIPAYTLEPATSYMIAVTATTIPALSGNPSYRTTTSSSLQVGRSTITAIINGAASRTINVNDVVVLNASATIDPDYPQRPPNYTWLCVNIGSSYGSSCGQFSSSSTSMLRISSGILSSGSYNITLVARTLDGQQSSASVILKVVERLIPSIRLVPLSAKYNYDSKIIITAIIGSNYTVSATWSTGSIANFSTNGGVLTPLTMSIPMTSTGSMQTTTFQMAIAPFALTTGATYTFQLSAFYTTLTAPTTASITANLVVNGPPQGGSLSSSPTSGLALSRLFLLNAPDWIDDVNDYPLGYAFLYNGTSTTSFTLIKGSDAVSYVSTILGQGLASNSYKVTVMVTVSDYLGCASNTSTTVTVSPMSSDKSVIISTANSLLSLALNGSDSNGLVRTVGAVLPSINVVNCTTAVSCASLNRDTCRYTRNTCGKCLSGYLGTLGDSNLPCLPKSSLLSDGEACTTSTQCLSGRCIQKICRSSNKACPGSCSGAGSCLAYDLFGSSLPSCAYNDSNCVVKCSCKSGQYGRDCSLSRSQYVQLIAFRENLCHSLYSSLSFQDVSSNVIESRATIVTDILVDMDAISESAVMNCTAVLVQTIAAHPSLACNGDVAYAVSRALSQVLELFTASTSSVKTNSFLSTLFNQVQNAARLLSTGCQALLALGEDPVAVATSNLRLVSATGDLLTLSNLTLQSAITEYEEATGTLPSTITVDSSFLSSMQTAGLTLIQFCNNPLGIKTNASVVELDALVYSESSSTSAVASSLSSTQRINDHLERRLSSTSSSQRIPNVTVVLQNTDAISYVRIPSSNVTLRCDRWSNTPYFLSTTCPDLTFVNLTCPVNLKGVFNVTCPSVQAIPRCMTWSGDTMVINPLCRVTSYSPTTTTCQCDNSYIDSRRRRLEQQGNFSQQYSSSLYILRGSLKIDFLEGDPIHYAQSSVAVMGAVIGLAAFLFVGLISLYFWTQQVENKTKGMSKKKYMVEAEKESSAGFAKHDEYGRVRTIDGLFYSILPLDFRGVPWRRLFCKYLVEEYTVLGVLPFMHEDDLNLVHILFAWISIMAKVLTFLLLSTSMAWLYYADDNSCQDRLQEEDCHALKTFFGQMHACHWKEDNGSCEFSSPGLDPRLIFLLTMIICFIALPYNILLTMAAQAAVHVNEQRSEAVVAVSSNDQLGPESFLDLGDSAIYKTTPSAKYLASSHQEMKSDSLHKINTVMFSNLDEFADLQTFTGKIMRAARLRKLQATCDFREDEGEAKYLQRTIAKKLAVLKNMAINASAVAVRDKYDVQRRYSVYDRDLQLLTPKRLLKRIKESRESAATVRHHMRFLSSEEKQEQYLLWSFISEVMPVYLRPLLREVMQRSSDDNKELFRSPTHPVLVLFEYYKPTLSLLFLGVHFALAAYFT
eukprot:scaffold4106_cov285-Ochromonas_danica.AAC.1